MTNLSRTQSLISWVMQLAAAGILLQTLFFKFTGADESVYIFSSLAEFVHVPAVEPWGRIGSGVMELIAAMLLLIPATAVFGAILAIGLMAGAILTHLLVLGIDVRGDGGLLFGLGVAVVVASLVVIGLRRDALVGAARFFQPA